jgi:hypothetical protein
MALIMVVGKDRPPSCAEAAAQLGVTLEDIDVAYGVVEVDAGDGLYAVLVRADRLPAAKSDANKADASQPSQPYRGPYSNPKIRPLD